MPQQLAGQAVESVISLRGKGLRLSAFDGLVL
jgi:hypothetical protein